MGATTVSGTILGVDNAPRVGVYVYFRLKTTGTDSVATSTIDATRISAVTDSNGQFSTILWDNGDSGVASIMEIQMPSGQRHEVIIPAGNAAIDVWDLIENYTVGTAAPQFGKLAAITTSVTSTTYTALATDAVILVYDDTAAATVTITLPAAATAGDGFQLTIKKLGSTADVIIDADGIETIDNALTNTIKLYHDWRKLVSDGSNWHIIS